MEETSIAPQKTSNDKPYNMDPNVEAMFAYLPLIGLFTSLAILIMEKSHKFIRFHAYQGLFFAVAYFLLATILNLTVFLMFLMPFVNLTAFLVWGFMMWKAYEKEWIKLPVIGEIAGNQVK